MRRRTAAGTDGGAAGSAQGPRAEPCPGSALIRAARAGVGPVVKNARSRRRATEAQGGKHNPGPRRNHARYLGMQAPARIPPGRPSPTRRANCGTTLTGCSPMRSGAAPRPVAHRSWTSLNRAVTVLQPGCVTSPFMLNGHHGRAFLPPTRQREDVMGILHWSADVGEVFRGDLTAAAAYLTPAGGAVATGVAPCGLANGEAGMIWFTTSLGLARAFLAGLGLPDALHPSLPAEPMQSRDAPWQRDGRPTPRTANSATLSRP
jgi:hypothetical protein